MVNPVFLIIVPLGFAFSIPLFSLIPRKIVKFIPPLSMLFNFIVSIVLMPVVLNKPIVISLGGFPPPFCISLFVGPVGILFSALIALVGFLVSIYGINYIKDGDRYHILYLLLLTGATGVVLTGDIFNLFVFYEILCISSYALVSYLGEKPAVESSVKYLIQGSIGSSFVLIGIAFLYGKFGTLNMADIAKNINSVSQMYLFLPLILFITGFGIEAAIFPLNAWLPDAHSSAPSTISAILSGIAIKIGIYGIARIIFTIFGISSILYFLLFLGLLTLLIGELSAFSQKNIKRMLAYSSIGQMGLILFAISLATLHSIEGGLFQIITHAFSKSLLFLTAGYMIYKTGTTEISSLEGMGREMPLTSLGFTIGAFSLIGLPPFMGFGSKFLIISSILEKGGALFVLFAGIVLLGTVIEGTYFFKIIQVLYFKKGKSEESVKLQKVPVSALIPMFILVILIITIGIYPGIVSGILKGASGELLNKVQYINNALGR
ncbi:NADH-quinone oxidoreductase subunit F [bacterium]|nr:NADH-quinone oxidoreductase subunit F [bacterium]